MTVPRSLRILLANLLIGIMMLAGPAIAQPGGAPHIAMEENPAFTDSYLAAETAFEKAEFQLAADNYREAIALSQNPDNQSKLNERLVQAQELEGRKAQLTSSLPEAPEARAAELLARYERGKQALNDGDLATARENLEFAWIVANFEDSRFILDDVAARQATASAEGAKADAEVADLTAASKVAEGGGDMSTAAMLMSQASALKPGDAELANEAMRLTQAVEMATPSPVPAVEPATETASDAASTATDVVSETTAAATDAASQTTDAVVAMSDPVTPDPVPVDPATSVTSTPVEEPEVVTIADPASTPAVPEPDPNVARAAALVAEGDAAAMMQNYDAAINAFQQASSLMPGDASIQAKLSNAQSMKAASAPPEPMMTPAPPSGPTPAEMATMEAESAMAANDLDTAVAKYREALSHDPSNAMLQRALVDAETRQNENRAMAMRAAMDAEAANAANNAMVTSTPVQDPPAPMSSTPDPSTPQASADAMGFYEQGQRAEAAGDTAAALNAYSQALALAPTEPRYQEAVNRTSTSYSVESQTMVESVREENRDLARDKYNDGLDAYHSGDLLAARTLWSEAVAIDPTYTEAQVQLDETAEEFAALSTELERARMSKEKEDAAEAKLKTLVTLSTARATPLVDFLDTLSLVSGINYSIEAGVDAQVGVNVRFEDQAVHDVLDAALLPNGLRWERRGDVILITADLTTEVFPLNPDQARKVRILLDAGELEKLMRPPGSTQVAGTELRLDDRRNLLIITDSRDNIKRLKEILANLDREGTPELVFRTFQVRERMGPKLKALLDNVLKADPSVPANVQTLTIFDPQTSSLIVRGTKETIARAEEILTDQQGLLNNLEEGRLGIETFSLLPRTPLLENNEQLQAFAQDTVEVIETFLYAETGREEARRQGRRLWFDPALLQVTIVDTRQNLREVADFISSLQVLEQEERLELIILKNADSGTLSAELTTLLGLEGDTGAQDGGGGGNERTVSLSVDGETEFRDLVIRVVRVNQNDVNDDNDDSVEMVIRTNTDSQELTIEDFRSQFVGDYEITALDVRPASTEGEGRARLQIRFVPAGGVAEATPTPAPAGGAPGAAAAGEDLEDERSLNITSVESLNALLIRFNDVALYNRVRDLIEKLDIPVLQVSIGTNFVEVNENRAKEYGSEFAIDDMINNTIDWDDGIIDFAFGRDTNELRSIFEPPIEYGYGAQLLKGTSVVSFDFGALSGNLRMAEAEGILNVVTGPQVTVLNGDTAEFRISLSGGQGGVGGTTTNTGGNTGGGNDPNQGGTGNQNQNNGTVATGAITNLDLVDLEIEPSITQLGSITMDITVDINEFTTDTGRPQTQDGIVVPQFGDRQAVANNFGLQIKTKELQTRARVNDGGTIVLGGFTGERTRDLTSGIPVLRSLPYVGKVLFGRNLKVVDKTTLLIFLNANIIE